MSARVARLRFSRHAFGMALLCCGAAGCRHQPPPPPPVAQAPPLNPASITVITPLPSVPPESKPDVRQAPVEQPKPALAAQPVKHTRRPRRKTTPPAVSAAETSAPAAGAPTDGGSATHAALTPATTQPAGASDTSGVSQGPAATNAAGAAPALGELSTGVTISSAERSRMLSQIQAQETRLGKLKEPAGGDALAVRLQVKSFLAKAREAVAENDLDGAETLNTKARVLLDELESE